MELIIAVVLGLILIGRFVSKKTDEKSYDEKRLEELDQLRINKTVWLRRVTDRVIEAELEEYIYDKRNEEAVKREVMEVLDTLVWSLPETARYDNVLCLRILMAKRGKLRFEDANNGIHIFGHGETEVRRRNDLSAQIGLFLWINKQLKRNGINEPMYVVLNAADKEAWLMRPEEKRVGYYIWKPMMMPNSDIHE